MKTIDLRGCWAFQMDPENRGPDQDKWDTIELPGTTSYRKKGPLNNKKEIAHLTDSYHYEGSVWFERKYMCEGLEKDESCYLHLERTRLSEVWIDGELVGQGDSLCTPHEFEVTKVHCTQGVHTIRIKIDNTGYLTKGGHMTSPDTQTNWNGITGAMEIRFEKKKRLQNVRFYPNAAKRLMRIRGKLIGCDTAELVVEAASCMYVKEAAGEVSVSHDVSARHEVPVSTYAISGEEFDVIYQMGDEAKLWSEFEPNLYDFSLGLVGGNEETYTVGLRDFETKGTHFHINGFKTFLRGKHDGLIFPRTGFAPTDVEAWMSIMRTAKEYGINHYRFHTCCPPKAAFQAADRLGIYMQPELPFWGTINQPDHEETREEHAYLVREGYRILEAFGNHPSFVMMSLGNELWGDQTTINQMLGDYKSYDARPLYTQGCNNFQFMPVQLDNDDFFSGVRFSGDRLIRGSYAMCDAPQGHIQTENPSTIKDYDACFGQVEHHSDSGIDSTIEIQYETGVKKVSVNSSEETFNPTVPVISHEIGQYQTYPDYDEIKKYTGPLKARNFEVFRDRLIDAGLGEYAKDYFYNSGQLAMACYKEELEAAIRSRKLAGFQLLDLQDFSGQGTALVGVLDAFMESKGLIEAYEWRQFCSDIIIIGRFDSYIAMPGAYKTIDVQVAKYRPGTIEGKVCWELILEDGSLSSSGEMVMKVTEESGVIDIGRLNIHMPDVTDMCKARLELSISGSDIRQGYDFWIIPEVGMNESKDVDNEADDANNNGGMSPLTIVESNDWDQARLELAAGKRVLFYPESLPEDMTIEGTYCTDFWCYPMFRSISESMGKPVPVGTLGMIIDAEHPVFDNFATETYTTPQWYPIITGSNVLVIDNLPKELRSIVSVIDNFERNHRLSLLVEVQVGEGQLMICMASKEHLTASLEGKKFYGAVKCYMSSSQFVPSQMVDMALLDALFCS